MEWEDGVGGSSGRIEWEMYISQHVLHLGIQSHKLPWRPNVYIEDRCIRATLNDS